MGSGDHLTVADWYGGGAAAQFPASRRPTASKLDSELAQLVTAMSSYSSSHPAFDPAAVPNIPADANLHGTIAAAWHS